MKTVRLTINNEVKEIQIREKDERSFNEKIIRQAICDFRDEFVGGQENAYMDMGEEEYLATYGVLTNTEVEANIYYELMCGKGNVIWTHKGLCIEKKHVKFLGSDYIRAMIRDRVKYDYDKNGWSLPCKWED